MYKPKEILINNKVKNDFITENILKNCKGALINYVDSGSSRSVVGASELLSGCTSMLQSITTGKQVLYVAPAGNAVDVFEMPDSRINCPAFDRLKLASNGCPYRCDWCYLKLTFRASRPYSTVRGELDKIKSQIEKRLQSGDNVIGNYRMFNSGELADSLALEHLTCTLQEMIPFFAQTRNGYLLMLTKSDNIDPILKLKHNKHTVIAWSLNSAQVSRQYEIGAPTLSNRVRAAQKAEAAGYPVRLRLDPIVPFDGWKQGYAETVKHIFREVKPERITLGTLRFEKGFFNMQNSIFTTDLKKYVRRMKPMFPSRPGVKDSKYSFSEDKRTEIFDFVINEIQKYSDCKIALCKESSNIWGRTGLDLSRCSCVCQYNHKNMS